MKNFRSQFKELAKLVQAFESVAYDMRDKHGLPGLPLASIERTLSSRNLTSLGTEIVVTLLENSELVRAEKAADGSVWLVPSVPTNQVVDITHHQVDLTEKPSN
jgi:hypothetical protein